MRRISFRRLFKLLYRLRKLHAIGTADEQNEIEHLAKDAIDYFVYDYKIHNSLTNYVDRWNGPRFYHGRKIA